LLHSGDGPVSAPVMGGQGVARRAQRRVVRVPAPAPAPRPAVVVSAEPSGPPEAAQYDYEIQYVGLNLESMRPRSPFNTYADRCLVALGADEMGGAGLGYGDCAHYGGMDQQGRPVGSTAKPKDGTIFKLLEDGRLQNKQTGWCVRRVQCHGEYVYDLGDCGQPAVSVFNLWEARSNQADVTDFVGLPLKGVDRICSSCGPYLLKQLCGTKETSASCGSSGKMAGWTKRRVQMAPQQDEHRYTLQFAPAPRPLCGTRVQQMQPLDLLADDPVPPWYYFHKYKDGKLV